MSHIETERKFIIKMPDINALSSMPDYTSSSIEQIYLTSEINITHRIRRREYQGRVEYTETKKIRISKISAIEEENEITESEYITLSHKIREGSRPVIKERHTIKIGSQLYEIDIYPFWKSIAILEAEFEGEETRISIPDVFFVVKEVSGMREYTNAALAFDHPDENNI